MASVNFQALEDHLATRSYIDGFLPSQADVHAFTAFESAPDASKFPHSSRWYKHIASYSSVHATLAGTADAAKSLLTSAVAAVTPAAAAEEDDDIDLFGSDDEEEDAEAEKLKAERAAIYAAKKANKPVVAAKSVVTIDVKPWDDETDMVALEAAVRAIEMDGLLWGGSKLVPVGYGIRKLQINIVVEDDKVSLEELQDKIAEIEDYVQNSDIAAMQKL